MLLKQRFLHRIVTTCQNYRAIKTLGSASSDQTESVVTIQSEGLTKGEIETRVLLSEANAGLLIGKKGANIKSLEKSTGTIINVTPKEYLIKGELVPIIIRGKSEDCSEAKEEIERLAVSHPETTLWVPQTKSRMLIGKGGAMINTLQYETGTWLTFDNDLIKDGLVPFTIKGPSEKCTAAKAKIEQLIADHAEITLWVPNTKGKMGMLIGRGGSAIAVIEQDTGTLISQNLELTKDGLVPISIQGPSEQCTAAKAKIEQLLADHSETTLLVPETKLGMLLGKGGSDIAALEQDTGTLIDLDKESMKDGLVPLVIRGSPEQCTAAKAKIEQLIADHSTTTLWIPQTNIGVIIGRAGAMQKTLEQDTGTVISPGDKNSIKNGLVPVTVMGPSEKCTAAKAKIEQLIAEYSETTLWLPQTKIGMIIGRAGAMHKTLERETGTWIGHGHDSIKDGLVPVTIMGPAEKCTEAKAKIEQLIAEYSEISLWVPDRKIGVIIGKKGKEIAALEQNTGTFIAKDEDKAENGFVPVTIQGSPENCNVAKERIVQQLLANHSKATPRRHVKQVDARQKMPQNPNSNKHPKRKVDIIG